MSRILHAIAAGWLVAFFPAVSSAQDQPTPDEQSIIEAALIAEAIKIMEQNIKASERESGEIDKLVRALSGVSIGDIQKYGLCGGPNSEVRKLFGSLCNDI